MPNESPPRSFKLDRHAKDPRLPHWIPWLILALFIALSFFLLWIKG
jgi:hypothetical protein